VVKENREREGGVKRRWRMGDIGVGKNASSAKNCPKK